MKKMFTVVVACFISMSIFATNNTHIWNDYNLPKLSEVKRQHPKKVSEEANQFYIGKDYPKAYVYYLALSQMKIKLSIEDTYRLGKTALYSGHYRAAKEHLQKSVKRTNRFPLVTFEYASALKRTGDYEGAVNFYKEYVGANAQDKNNEYVALAKRHVSACSKAMRIKVESDYMVEDMENSLDFGGNTTGLTTPSKHNIRLIEYKDKEGSCIKKVMPGMDIQVIAGSAGNPIFNSGAPHIAPDGETVYFTREEKTAAGRVESKIYIGKITEEGEIIDIRKLGPGVNRIGCSSLYPSIALSEHGQEILYFASTIPGGRGGYDLWYSVRMTNGEYTRPYNLGMRINTEDDEVTPFYNQETEELYFSSDKPEGFGGFDVYQVSGQKKMWNEDSPNHLSSPVNSHGDDTHFILDHEGKGYFSSDRASKKEQKMKMYHFTEDIKAQSQYIVPEEK